MFLGVIVASVGEFAPGLAWITKGHAVLFDVATIGHVFARRYVMRVKLVLCVLLVGLESADNTLVAITGKHGFTETSACLLFPCLAHDDYFTPKKNPVDRRPPGSGWGLVADFGYETSAYCLAAFTDGESHPFLAGDRGVEGESNLSPLSGLEGPDLTNVDGRRHVGSPEVELRGVPGAEARVTTTLLRGKGEDLGLARLVGLEGTGLDDHLAPDHPITLHAPQEQPYVEPGVRTRDVLVERLDACDDRLGGLPVRATDDLDGVTHLDGSAVNAPCDDGSTTRDRANAFDGHEERRIHVPLGHGDVLIHRINEGLDGLDVLACQSLRRRSTDERSVLGESLTGEHLTNLHLDKLDHLRVGDIALVDEHDHVTNPDLLGKQDVLTGLVLGALAPVHQQDRSIHLRSARDHVLDVVGVPWAVDVGVVTSSGLVLDVRSRDGDPTLFLFGCVVDLVEALDLSAVKLRHDLGDGRRQGSFPVIDVTNGADVDVLFL